MLGPAVSTAVQTAFERLGVCRVFESVAQEFATRDLGERELRRIEIAYEEALRAIAQHVDKGGALRDEFFRLREDTERTTGRTAAEEALEGVLLKARDAYEERKAEHLGKLYKFIASESEITNWHGNYLVELAGRLTYHQLLYLGMFSLEEEARVKLRDWEGTGSFTWLDAGLASLLYELASEGLVVRDDNRRISSPVDVNPRRLRTVLNGSLLVVGMNLGRAYDDDVLQMNDALRRFGTIDVEKPGGTKFDVVVPPGTPSELHRAKLGQQVMRFPPMPDRLEPNDKEEQS